MSEKAHRILPHGPIEELTPGLWSITGSLPFPMKRNMIVHRLPDGGLLLHSAVALDDAGLAALEALGQPAVCIVPSSGHRLDAPFYKRRHPRMKVICPAEVRAKVEKVVPVDATCEELLPAQGVRIHPPGPIRGGELVYEVSVPGGKALLFCDLVTNSAAYGPGLVGFLMSKISGGVGRRRLGVARIVSLMMIKDRSATLAALLSMAAIPDLRLITVAHGRPVQGSCADALRSAASTV